MQKRDSKTDKNAIDVIVIDSKNGNLRSKTKRIDLDRLFVRSRLAMPKRNSALELVITVAGNAANVIHMFSGFVMRKEGDNIAIIFSEYNNDFSKTIRKKLSLPRATIIAYSK
jgi:hypothetical protein